MGSERQQKRKQKYSIGQASFSIHHVNMGKWASWSTANDGGSQRKDRVAKKLRMLSADGNNGTRRQMQHRLGNRDTNGAKWIPHRNDRTEMSQTDMI